MSLPPHYCSFLNLKKDLFSLKASLKHLWNPNPHLPQIVQVFSLLEMYAAEPSKHYILLSLKLDKIFRWKEASNDINESDQGRKWMHQHHYHYNIRVFFYCFHNDDSFYFTYTFPGSPKNKGCLENQFVAYLFSMPHMAQSYWDMPMYVLVHQQTTAKPVQKVLLQMDAPWMAAQHWKNITPA